MTEPPEQLRLWTFYNPNDGPMAIEIDGHSFTCEDVQLETLYPEEEIVNYWQTIQTTDWKVRLTFEISVKSRKNPNDIVYETRLVPNRISL